MRPHQGLSVLLSASVLLASQCTGSGQPARDGANSGGEASGKGPVSGPTDRLNYQADLFTGRFSYRIEMTLAPGRHGSEPVVALSYSSAGENGWCGVGWDLDFGFIQRENRRGVPVAWTNGYPRNAYDDGKGFVFSLNGRGASLVRAGTNEYRAEIESGFLRFVLLTNLNQWQVTDLSGNRYYFGTNAASRMSNSKAGWPSNSWNGTYRWALTRCETALGDSIDYTYTNISGMLYPLRVSYNGHTAGLTNSHTVDFILGARTDVKLSYASGYRVEQNRRLEALVHKVSGQVVWSNRLTYAQSPGSLRSLLKSVTRHGTNLTSSLPPATFDYSVQQFGFQPVAYWTNIYVPPGMPDYYHLSASGVSLITGHLTQYLDMLDMDGDSLPDRVYQNANYPFTSLWVQRNNGSGFENATAYGPLSIQNYSDALINVSSYNQPDWAMINAVYARLLDLNADGLPDRVCDPIESLSGLTNYPYRRLAVQLNGGTNWASGSDVSWTNVFYTNYVSGDPAVTDYRVIEREGLTNVVMADMNGDGLPDRLMALGYGSGALRNVYTNYLVQFNTGSGFTGTNRLGFQRYDTYQPSYGMVINSQLVRLLDINGDGLPDRVMFPTNATTGGAQLPDYITNYVVEYNNGYGFEAPVYWGGVVARYTNTCGTVIYNPDYYLNQQSIQDTEECALRDINGDGLPDRIYRHHYCSLSNPHTNWMVQINRGTNFASPVLYGPYYSQNQINDLNFTGIQGPFAKLMDMNGDGIPDHVMRSYPGPPGGNPYYAVELGKGPVPDLLTVVSNGIGGSATVAYKSSVQWNNRESATGGYSRNMLPFPVQTVAAVSVADGLYPSNTTTYIYEGGKWNAERREFDGFARVTQVDPLGTTNVHWFHQAGGRDYAAFGEYQDSTAAIGKKGMPFRIETTGTNGQLYGLVLNKVEDADLGNGRHFGFVSQTLSLDYPAATNYYRATAQQFAHDLNTGNLTNQTDFGEVTNVAAALTFSDVPGDTVYQLTAYASLANPNILDRPQRVILASDSAGQGVLRETLYTYEGNTGNLAQQRDRLCPDCYLTNAFSYDLYNNQSSATNEAGIVTTTLYDSGYQTFPVQETVGGGFTSGFKHDPRSGSVLLSTNMAGLVTSNAYDAFLRLVETSVSSVPNATPTQWVARYDYRLGMAGGISTNSVRLRRSDGVDPANGHETWTYSDGLGRTLQIRAESESNNVFRVTDTIFDRRGNTRFVTLPYFSAGTNFTKPSGALLGKLTEYDPIARPSKVTAGVNGTFNASGQMTAASATGGDSGSPLAPAEIAYHDGNDPWTRVLSDEAAKVRKYSLDAYGRTNRIVEVTSASNYITRLAYSPAGDLTNITDNAGNQLQYAYNDLGQMVAMADPDMGVWLYRRDGAGRVREQVDGNNQMMRFNYDDPLGRLRSRQIHDHTGARIQHYEYSAFGQDRFTESATAFPVSQRYTSQVKDEDTGLYYYGARYYDPQLGRFIQPDLSIPSVWNPQHLNRYNYALNNPLKFVDPSGYAPQLTGFIYNPKTGGTQLHYMDYHFGDSMRAAQRGALEKPTLVIANEMLNAAAEATYDPNIGKLETTQLYLLGVGFTILGVVDLVPGEGKAVTKPLTEVAEKTVERTVRREVGSKAAKGIPPVIYRGGKPSPSNLKLRPGEDALSFRDTVSNPLPKTERPVFRPGDDYIGIDTSKLPPGSVVPDNVPPGHVSVQGVTPEQLQQAVIERGKFPQ